MRGFTKMDALVFVVATVLAAGCASPEKRFRSARAADTVAAYREFLAGDPPSGLAQRARERLVELEFDEARGVDTAAAYEAFVARHTRSARAADASLRIAELRLGEAEASGREEEYLAFVEELRSKAKLSSAQDAALAELAWRAASSAATTNAFSRYLRLYEDGAHSDEARSAIDESDWHTALAMDSEASYRGYLRAHPRGAHFVEAKKAIAEIERAAAEAERAKLQACVKGFRVVTTTAPQKRWGGLSFTMNPFVSGFQDAEMQRVETVDEDLPLPAGHVFLVASWSLEPVAGLEIDAESEGRMRTRSGKRIEHFAESPIPSSARSGDPDTGVWARGAWTVTPRQPQTYRCLYIGREEDLSGATIRFLGKDYPVEPAAEPR